MNDNTEKRAFVYTEEEAEIVARCEMGIYDLPEKGSLAAVLCFAAVIGGRMIAGLPLPSLRVLGSYAVCAAAWILFLVYLKTRVKQIRKDLSGRELYLYYGADGVEIYEVATLLRFHCFFSDIAKVERGDRVCRVYSKAGRICFPLRLLSAAELQQLDALETAKHSRKHWM